MYIQPLLLTVPAARPGTIPGYAVRGARTDPAGSTSRDRRSSDAKATREDLPRAGRRDTVEISREAEARLVGQLNQQEQSRVEILKSRDREVRAHEQAHLAAAGPNARGGANYDYTTGPDGRRYVVGGEVNLDAAPVPDDPEATIQKAQVVRAAALAPAKPSAQDRRVAAAASKMEAEAGRELRQQEQAEQEEAAETDDLQAFIGTHFDVVV